MAPGVVPPESAQCRAVQEYASVVRAEGLAEAKVTPEPPASAPPSSEYRRRMTEALQRVDEALASVGAGGSALARDLHIAAEAYDVVGAPGVVISSPPEQNEAIARVVNWSESACGLRRAETLP